MKSVQILSCDLRCPACALQHYASLSIEIFICYVPCRLPLSGFLILYGALSLVCLRDSVRHVILFDLRYIGVGVICLNKIFVFIIHSHYYRIEGSVLNKIRIFL